MEILPTSPAMLVQSEVTEVGQAGGSELPCPVCGTAELPAHVAACALAAWGKLKPTIGVDLLPMR